MGVAYDSAICPSPARKRAGCDHEGHLRGLIPFMNPDRQRMEAAQAAFVARAEAFTPTANDGQEDMSHPTLIHFLANQA